MSITRAPVARPTLGKEQQIQQILKKYPNNFTIKQPTKTTITINLKPTDPDFPFDLDSLKLKLLIPDEGNTSISILSPDIPDQYKQHIQFNWLLHASKYPNKSLLDQLNWLDRSLESLLSTNLTDQVSSSISFVCNADTTVEEKPREFDLTNAPSIPCIEEESIEEEQQPKIYPLLHKGTNISFPDITLSNTSFIKITSLHITIQCVKCKTTSDVHDIKPSPMISPTVAFKWLECGQCKTALGYNYRPDYIHETSKSIGYLDFQNAKLIDLLHLQISSTCTTCNHECTIKKIVRGKQSTTNCPHCFLKISVLFDQVRILVLPSVTNEIATPNVKRKKKVDEKEVSLVLGEPLPKNGACLHYKKSYRWFRFPCCNKLYPCDICHRVQHTDQLEDVWATRIVCGFCSKEVKFNKSQETCTACGKEMFNGTSAGGFWEGGKGTRDQSKMSRNEDRKYRGLSKTVSGKAMKKK